MRKRGIEATLRSLCLVAVCIAIGVSFTCAASEGPLRPNIIFITVDTFRPDRISYDGYHRNTSPHIDAISREGVFFKRAFTTSGWTSPGLISLLTSLYAPAHGVDIRGKSLDPGVVTLPDKLAAAGYYTPDIFFLTSIPNFKNLGLEPYARRAQYIDQGDDIIFKWLEEEADNKRPFFLYYHYRDLHQPYNPGAPYEELFLPEAFASTFGFLSSIKRFFAAEKMGLVQSQIMLTRGVMDFGLEDKAWVDALYDAQVFRLDEQFFGRLRRTLQEKGLEHNTLLVISADHGEELLDHGLIGHISTFKEGRLYDEIIRIPLIFWMPDRLPQGAVVEELVQATDVMPTILDLLDIAVPVDAQGQSMLPLVDGQPGWRRKAVYCETSGAGYTADQEQYLQRFRAVRTEDWKLTYASPNRTYELFDLRRDPDEAEDVLTSYPQVADSLKSMLEQWLEVVQKSVQQMNETAIDTRSIAAAPAVEAPQILFPQNGDTLYYQGVDHTIQLRWTGPTDADYAIEYEVGVGSYYLTGILPAVGSMPSYGPYQANFWNGLVLYNPWRFRVYRTDQPYARSAWVTFYLASDGTDEDLSPLGILLRAQHSVRTGLEASGHLIWGLGRGLVDLYLWVATAPAADISAYILLLAIIGVAFWPLIQRWGIARCKAWGLVLLYIAFVYSTIPLMPQIWKILQEHTQGAIRYLGIGVIGVVALVLLVQVWRSVGTRTLKPYIVLILVCPIYAYLLGRYATFPAERLHLVEYGFMGFVFLRALRIDFAAPNAYIMSFALTVLVGFGDECIQWVLPQRFFELKDVQLNAISGALGLLVTAFVLRGGKQEATGGSGQ